MAKSSSNIKKMGGIDTRFARESSRFSDGKNFYTRGGSLFTRPGTSIVESPLTSDIISMVSAPLPGQKTILIVQQGNKLFHLKNKVWAEKYTLTSDKPLKYCRFINKILMVNGTDKLAYDIVFDNYSSIAGSGDDAMPNIEHLVTWRFRPFGWSPNTSESHMLRFSGYDEDDMIDPSVWPPSFSLNVGGASGSPIFAAFASGNHLLVLTESTYTPVFGNTENDFEIGASGMTSVLRPDTAGAIDDNVLWLGKDITGHLVVYLYSGTEPVIISEPIQDLIPFIELDTVFTKTFLNQFWVICNGKTDSRVLIYDVSEREWFVYEFPFTISSGTVFGEYLDDDYIYIGSSSTVIKLDPLVNTDIDNNVITTSFIWGPIGMNNRMLKPKTLYVVAEPSNDFNLAVTPIIDDNEEPEAVVLIFESLSNIKQVTESIRVPRDKGYNMSYKFSTTDNINKINGLTVVYKAKGEK